MDKAVWSRDASGGNSATWSTRTAAVACLVTQQNASTPGEHHQLDGVNVSHTVSFLTASSAVAAGDRLYVLTGPSAGKYLKVLGVAVHGTAGSIAQFTRLSCTEHLE